MPEVRPLGVDDAGQLPAFFPGVLQFVVEGLGGRGFQAEVLPLLLGTDGFAHVFRHPFEAALTLLLRFRYIYDPVDRARRRGGSTPRIAKVPGEVSQI